MADQVRERTAAGAGRRADRRHRTVRGAALLAVATASAVIGGPHLAGAHVLGARGLTPKVEANVAVEGPIKMEVADDARVITTHLTVAPLGYTAWHYHPGPHFVSLIKGTAVVYETDCTVRGTFGTGQQYQGFYDAGATGPSHVGTERDVHLLRNPSATEVLELVITDIREEGLPPTVVVEPQLEACFE